MKKWLLALALPFAMGMASIPPEDMSCAQSAFPNPSTVYIKCKFPALISKFTTAPEPAIPSALLVPATGKAALVAHFNGYNAYPTDCDDWNFSAQAAIVTKNCPAHYPSILDYPGQPLAWGGAFNGELAEGWRIAATLKYAQDHYPNRIDWGAGVTLEGSSYGGTTAILQSLLMPEPWTKALLTVVNAVVPNTLFVKQETPVGMYWRPAVRLAWGSFYWPLADARTQATGRVYYRINGSPNDSLVVFDTAFFRDVCDAKEVPCFGTWHNCGHQINCPGSTLPFSALYTDGGMSHRLDQPQIAFTHSAANSPLDTPEGHYNLGLAWFNAMTDTPGVTIIPIRYRQLAPEQPSLNTFNVTVRNTKQKFNAGDAVRWAFGSQQGTAIAQAGKVTVAGLQLLAGLNYTNLELRK